MFRALLYACHRVAGRTGCTQGGRTGGYQDQHDPTRPTRTAPPGQGVAVELSKVLNLGTGLRSPGRVIRQPGRVTSDPGIRHLRSLNSVTLALNPVFIRVLIPGFDGFSIDWIDEGAIVTCRGRGKLW